MANPQYIGEILGMTGNHALVMNHPEGNTTTERLVKEADGTIKLISMDEFEARKRVSQASGQSTLA